MVNQALVSSGFDVEILLSERYLVYTLLAQVEAGLLSLTTRTERPPSAPDEPPVNRDTILSPPEDYELLYVQNPDVEFPDANINSFVPELLFDHPNGGDLKVNVAARVVDNISGLEVEGFLELFVSIGLEFEEDGRGFQSNHGLTLEVVDIDGTLVALAALGGQSKDELLEDIKDIVDRTVPLGVVDEDQRVQKVELFKHRAEGAFAPAFGVYLNLALKTGPEADAFLGDRGGLALAQNFLETGADLAFATSAALFGNLGPDLKARRAEQADDGGFSFPLREDPSDDESKVVGRIKSFAVGPEIVGTVLTGQLEVNLHGEYTDAPLEPDFNLRLLFRPVVEDGLLRWDLDTDLDLGIAGSLLVLVSLGVVAILFSPGGALSAFLLIALAQELIAEPIVSSIVAEKARKEADASFLDVLPHRVPAARRRWDPLYVTEHQVVAKLEEVTINQRGIAFQGVAVLDKQPVPVDSVVIRDEERDNDGNVTHLRYRVDDFEAHEEDFAATAPGVDRLGFSRSDPAGEPDHVSVSVEQIGERIDAGSPDAPQRLHPRIPLVAKKVHVAEGQIDDILCITRREHDAERERLVSAFRAEKRNEIVTDQGDEIREAVVAELEAERQAAIDAFREVKRAEIIADQGDDIRDSVTEELEQQLGRPPTEQEIADALEARVEELVDAAQAEFEADVLGPPPTDEEIQRIVDERIDELLEAAQEVYEADVLPGELSDAIDRMLRLDLAPEEYAAFQQAAALIIEDKVIVVREGKPYYRDRPDGDPNDNLLALPRYQPPYEPP